MASGSPPPAVQHISSHILSHLRVSPRTSPLFVLFQGPQGAGKTYLCSELSKTLKLNDVSVAILSIDDLYLPHDSLVDIAQANASNPLLQGRGQPGTHDLPLGSKIFQALKEAREGDTITLPFFDKSLFNGEGDRAKEGVVVDGKADVVVVEGWCTGFYPLSDSELSRRFRVYESGLATGPTLPTHKLEHVEALNQNLKRYAEEWWSYFSVFVQLTPLDLVYVHKWRLQQEHAMKAKNGGRGMTDEEVKAFVDRYLPGYYYFSDGVDHGYDVPPTVHGEPKPGPPWAGRGIRIVLDDRRDALRSEEV